MAEAKRKIEEELTCSVCLEFFQDPIILPCMHSFCRICVENIWKTNNRKLNCPLCKNGVSLRPNQTIDDLPKNFHLSNLVTAFKELNASNPNDPVRVSTISLREAASNSSSASPSPSPSPSSTSTRPNNANPYPSTRLNNFGSSGVSRANNSSTNQNSPYSSASAPPLANQQSTRCVVSVATEDDEDFSWVEPYEQFLLLMSSREQGGVPHHVTCSACKREVCGVRYRCRECVDCDLCSRCEAAGSHAKHDMIKVVNPTPSFLRIVFRTENTFFKSTKIKCDICSQIISGVRYHCCECEDFDLCKSCEQKNSHPLHDMRRVVSAKLFRNNVPTSDEANRMVNSGKLHPRVTCDVCSRAVRGFRYMCSVCANFDLCARCLVNGSHSEHDMRRIDPD